jgi:hypothetical protein
MHYLPDGYGKRPNAKKLDMLAPFPQRMHRQMASSEQKVSNL